MARPWTPPVAAKGPEEVKEADAEEEDEDDEKDDEKDDELEAVEVEEDEGEPWAAAVWLLPPVQSGDCFGLPFSSTGRPGAEEFVGGVTPPGVEVPEGFDALEPQRLELEVSERLNPPPDEVPKPPPD